MFCVSSSERFAGCVPSLPPLEFLLSTQLRFRLYRRQKYFPDTLSRQNCSRRCTQSGVDPLWDAASGESEFARLNSASLNDAFGNVIAFSADGSTVAVAAPFDAPINTGSVYLFVRNSAGGMIPQGGKITAGVSSSLFGYFVALSKEGNILLIGAPHESSNRGAAYIYTRSSTSGGWSQSQRLTSSPPAANAYFGYAVSMSADASLFAVGSRSGALALPGTLLHHQRCIDRSEIMTTVLSAIHAFLSSAADSAALLSIFCILSLPFPRLHRCMLLLHPQHVLSMLSTVSSSVCRSAAPFPSLLLLTPLSDSRRRARSPSPAR